MFIVISSNGSHAPKVNYYADELVAYRNFNAMISQTDNHRTDLFKIDPVNHESSIIMSFKEE